MALVVAIASRSSSSPTGHHLVRDERRDFADVTINLVDDHNNDNELRRNQYSKKFKAKKCLTTRSKCWSESECCSMECIPVMNRLPGICGRDE